MSRIINSAIRTAAVIFVIGLIIGIIGPVFTCRFYFECDDLIEIQAAIESYRSEEGRLPANLTALTIQTLRHTAYIKILPKDSWGNNYFYFKNDNADYILGSYGADGVFDGRDHNRDIYLHDEPCSLKYSLH